MRERRVFPSTDVATLQDVLARRFRCKPQLRRLGGYLGRSEVFAVDDNRYVLKVFHDSAQVKSKRERVAYEFLANRELPIARLTDSGVLPDGTPWILIDHLPGMLLQEVMPLETVRERDIFASVGSLLRRLHELDIPAELCAQLDTDVDAQYEGYAARLLEQKRDVHTLFLKAADLLRVFKPINSPRCFVHRDYGPRNLLVTQDSKEALVITGLIDFERAATTDPAVDLAMLWFKELRTSPERYTAFFEGYLPQKLDSALDRRVVYHTLGLLLEISLWAFADDPEFYLHALRALEDIVEQPTMLR